MKHSCLKKTQKRIKISPNPENPPLVPLYKGGSSSFSKRGTSKENKNLP
jgi:hypothetical protein